MDFRTFVNSIAILWSSHSRGDSANVHCNQIAVVRRRSQNAATPPLMGISYFLQDVIWGEKIENNFK
jgi:hypothetical protein